MPLNQAVRQYRTADQQMQITSGDFAGWEDRPRVGLETLPRLPMAVESSELHRIR